MTCTCTACIHNLWFILELLQVILHPTTCSRSSETSLLFAVEVFPEQWCTPTPMELAEHYPSTSEPETILQCCTNRQLLKFGVECVHCRFTLSLKTVGCTVHSNIYRKTSTDSPAQAMSYLVCSHLQSESFSFFRARCFPMPAICVRCYPPHWACARMVASDSRLHQVLQLLIGCVILLISRRPDLNLTGIRVGGSMYQHNDTVESCPTMVVAT